MAHRSEDDPAGVDDGAVEIEEDDGKAHAPDRSSALRLLQSRKPWSPVVARGTRVTGCASRPVGRRRMSVSRRCGGAVRPASVRRRPAARGGRRSGDVLAASIVPTSVRTMWRRNESALISKLRRRRRPRSTSRRRRRRTKVAMLGLGRCEGAKVVLADERRACGVERLEVERPRVPERPVRLERRALPPAPDRGSDRPRARVEPRVEVVRRPLRPRATARSGGRNALSASAARSGGGPPSTSTETTFASAWTPASVRPATASAARAGS